MAVIDGWFVYWISGWEMRRLSKLEIRFRMTSFSFFTFLDAGWKVSQAILALLDSFQERISNGKPELYKVYVFVLLYLISWSPAQFMRLVYRNTVCTFVLRPETMICSSMRFDISLQSFKKPLVDIFSPQIERKNVPKSI